MSIVQQRAPSFTAKAVVGGQVTDVELDDYRGRWVVLFFYPLDYTFVCPTEIQAYNAALRAHGSDDVVVMACSIDSVYTHLAWQQTPEEEGGVGRLDLIHVADVGGHIADLFGVLNTGGVALRAVFLIDPEGNVRHEAVNDLGVGRNTDETFRLLEAFRHVDTHGDLCPANWNVGDPTMTGAAEDRHGAAPASD